MSATASNKSHHIPLIVKSFDDCADIDQCVLLNNRIKYEDLIATLASRLLAVSIPEYNRVIVESLELIGVFLNVESVEIEQIDRMISHRWISPLHSGTISRLALPLKCGTETMGSLILSSSSKSYEWSNENVKRLHVMGHMIANVLMRAQLENKIHDQMIDQAQLRSELARSARISMMGELTAAMAHEINQPLAAILTNAQVAQRLLDMSNPSMDEFRDITKDIVKDVKRTRDVILKLRALFQKTKIDLAPLDVNEMTSELLELLKSQITLHEAALKTDFSETLPLVSGDRVQLQQVLTNLIMNALEAMKNSAVRELRIKTECSDGWVRIVVTDSGPGVSKEKREKIFEPFFTTRKEGMGLGLSISRAIMATHRGKLELDNTPNPGATFTMTLPAEHRRVPRAS